MRIRLYVYHYGGICGGVDCKYSSAHECVGLFRPIYEYNGAGVSVVFDILVFSHDPRSAGQQLFYKQAAEKYCVEENSISKNCK